MSGDSMGPDDFGLGADFDQALADATSEGGGGGGETEESGGGGITEGPLGRTDFSKLKMILDVPLKVSVYH